MDARNQKIRDVIGTGCQLQIPFFQRSYVWGEEEWKRFLESMKEISETHKDYFFGSIILKEVENGNGNSIIIDGQQRITTLLLFFKVLSLKGDRATSARAEHFLIKDVESNEFSLIHNRYDRPMYERILQLQSIEEIPSTSNLVRAYKYFCEHVVAEEYDLQEILKHLILIGVHLQTSDNEQVIFDTINSLGVRLTTAELLKNFLFSAQDRELYDEYWFNIFEKDGEKEYWDSEVNQGRIKRNNLEAFLYAYLHVKVCDQRLGITAEQRKDFRTAEGLFAQFKSLMSILESTGKMTKIDFTKDLSDYAKLYRQNFNNHIEEDAVSREYGIERLNLIMYGLDVSTMQPYVLYLLKEQTDRDEFNKMAKVLESYLMRRFVCKSGNDNYSDLFSRDILLAQATTEQALKNYLYSKSEDESLVFPGMFALERGFLESKLPNKRALGIHYMLESRLRSETSSTELKGMAYYTLEHLLPKKWKKNWPLENDVTVDERNSKLENLGNHTIIMGKLNTTISNASWQTKLVGKNGKEGLRTNSAGIITMAWVLTQNVWDETRIDERGQWLSQQATLVWPKDGEDISRMDEQGDNDCDANTGDITSIPRQQETQSHRHVKYRFNQVGSLSMGKAAFLLVQKFLKGNPSLTYRQLKEVFPDTILKKKFVVKGLLASKDRVEELSEKERRTRYGYGKPGSELKSADGVTFFVSTQWTGECFPSIIHIASQCGWTIEEDI